MLVHFNLSFYVLLYILLISHDIDVILILEHSFYLSQQDTPQPVSLAVQQYNASNTPARVGKSLEDVFGQYNRASETEKIHMVLNIITQNRMGELNIHSSFLFVNNSIPQNFYELNKDSSLVLGYDFRSHFNGGN